MTKQVNTPRGTGKKVLIVEDDQDFISILKIKFTNEGFSVVTAEDGEEGVAVADKEKPDLIMSDVLIPKLGGLEMAKKIRETDKKVPIVFLTNLKDADYINNIKKSGDFDYWIKSDLPISEIVKKVKVKLGVK